ncbi:iron uptake system protein EfeO [Cellulomonas marina]|uniref:Iron uptake system component EfeO n=1 Tax=Cellulomonas marina TaxID=988821 RepID=A0A1I0ZJA5_9CELL|nr:iron uptake system protein EfeO [Cellulomonas marina]GIG28652.1 lipoprotein [Cellulomonas marina]SFB25859.1 iron uptake system component EfeO [Cellulomonas marina]
MPRRPLALVGLVALALPLTACVPNETAEVSAAGTAGAGGGTGTVTVSSTADACELSEDTAPSGTLRFTVVNDGSDVTEFYLLAEDGLRVVSEVENVGPGLSRDLVVQVAPGTYVAQCKPGMVGDGIRSDFTVTDSGTPVGPTGDVAEQLAAAEASYLAYVRDQSGALIAATQEFAAAYAAGDDATARSLYAPTRVHWERIEPVAESFGDLDPLLDLREADLEEGATWTGWHLVEKDLWQPAPEANGGVAYTPLTPEQRQVAADDLVANTQRLVDQVNAQDFTVAAFQVSNGAKELLDEVATGKVTGEEEIWSHTDLWDFAANVDGADVAYGVLADVVTERDPELATELTERFDTLQGLLAQHGSYDAGFAGYDTLTDAQVKELAAAVDALSEPLSRLTATVTGA